MMLSVSCSRTTLREKPWSIMRLDHCSHECREGIHSARWPWHRTCTWETKQEIHTTGPKHCASKFPGKLGRSNKLTWDLEFQCGQTISVCTTDDFIWVFAPFFLRMEKFWEHFRGIPTKMPVQIHVTKWIFFSWIKVFLFTCQTGPAQNKARLQNRSSLALGNIHLTYARMFMEPPAAPQPGRGGTHNHQPQLEHPHQHHKHSAAKTRQHRPIHTRTANIIKQTRCLNHVRITWPDFVRSALGRPFAR